MMAHFFFWNASGEVVAHCMVPNVLAAHTYAANFNRNQQLYQKFPTRIVRFAGIQPCLPPRKPSPTDNIVIYG